MSDATVHERLAELEARFTLHQDLIDKLSDVIWRQQKELDALAVRTVALEKRLATSQLAGDAAPPDDEVPPHY